MTDHLGKALHYRDRSEECRRLAELSTAQIADHYRRMAAHYLELAEIEERLANHKGRPAEPGAVEPEA
jgi:hypothetical protein